MSHLIQNEGVINHIGKIFPVVIMYRIMWACEYHLSGSEHMYARNLPWMAGKFRVKTQPISYVDKCDLALVCIFTDSKQPLNE